MDFIWKMEDAKIVVNLFQDAEIVKIPLIVIYAHLNKWS
jgi:hypothetical protein